MRKRGTCMYWELYMIRKCRAWIHSSSKKEKSAVKYVNEEISKTIHMFQIHSNKFLNQHPNHFEIWVKKQKKQEQYSKISKWYNWFSIYILPQQLIQLKNRSSTVHFHIFLQPAKCIYTTLLNSSQLRLISFVESWINEAYWIIGRPNHELHKRYSTMHRL